MSSPSSYFGQTTHGSDSADIELQEELRRLFEVDVEKDLQQYLALVRDLQTDTWEKEIQSLYRAIHTIKGGAATVGADAISDVAIALEDLLSDLRYLESAPNLQDGHLQQVLLEGGELLASTISLEEDGDTPAIVNSKVLRLDELRTAVQQTYLPQWNQAAQLQCEFADQGFDLVVLDLEMALSKLSSEDPIPTETINLAQDLLNELKQIGEELKLDSGWSILLNETQVLIEKPQPSSWQEQWPLFLQALKSCAKNGGAVTSIPENLESGIELEPLSFSSEVSLELPSSISTISDVMGSTETLVEETAFPETLPDLDEMGELFDVIADFDSPVEATDTSSLTVENSTESVDVPISPPSTSASIPKSAKPATPTTENIPIPVPLDRLNRSAEQLVDTILAARATQGIHQALYPQILQLVALAQQNIKYITDLRQLQDDYALQDNADNPVTGPTLERYRKGYSLINRLLENSLRLSELGAETEQTSRIAAERLQSLDQQVLRLRDTVEDSRLLSFQNLGFRARAIIRDLTTRFEKPAQLLINGESLELDVGTVKSLEPALLHLIRNAFGHGLESSEERLALGKPEQGTITLTLQRRGSTFVLILSDDGRGIDKAAMQAKSRSLGLPLDNVDDDNDLLAVICQPGFSSQSEVDSLSGRGVGMDVVAEQINRLGGSLSLETQSGVGTTFTLKFPVPHLLVSCLLLQAGDRQFAIPTEQIVSTSLVKQLNIAAVENNRFTYDWEVIEGDRKIPALSLLKYWRSVSKVSDFTDTAIGININLDSGQSGIFLLADRLLDEVDLLIQPIPFPMIPPVGLMGVSLQPDGSLVPVLEAVAIMEQVQLSPERQVSAIPAPVVEDNRFQSLDPEGLTERAIPRILIIDDAALMRRRIEASLSAYGFATEVFADGLEAWNWIQVNPQPAMMISDIEMPNMDGFSLISQCRQAGINCPILVISSRLAEEWGREARRVGANDFLTKGFSTNELIDRVNYWLESNASNDLEDSIEPDTKLSSKVSKK